MPHLVTNFLGYRLLRNAYFHVAISVPYLLEKGFSFTEIFLFESVYYTAKAAGEIPTGIFADRLGRKLSLVIGSILAAVGYFIFFAIPAFWPIALAQICLGLSMGFSSGSDSALVYEKLQENGEIGKYSSVEGQAWSMRNLGFGVASATGAWFGTIYGFNIPFLASSLFISASVFFAIRLPREQTRKKPEQTNLQHFFAVPKYILQRPLLIYYNVFFGIIFLFVRTGFWTFQASLLYVGVSTSWFGILFQAVLIVSLVSGLMVHRIFGKMTITGVSYSMVCLVVLYHIIFPLVQHGQQWTLIFVMAAFASHAVVQGAYEPLMRDFVNELSEDGNRATNLSTVSLIGNLLFAIVAPFYGMIIEQFGVEKAVFLSLILMAIFLTPTMFFLHRILKQ